MSTKDRKLLEKENRRESILSAAETVMTKNGIHGLSIDLIANETQLAKGTIYLYFKNKEEILSILTIKARKMLFKEFQEIEKKDIKPLEKIKEIVNQNYLFYKKSPLYYDLMSLYEVNNTLTETEEMYKTSENFTNLVAGIVEEGKRDGSLNPEINSLHFTFSMWAMIVGVLQLIKVRGIVIHEKLDISEHDLLNNFMQTLEHGIKK